MKEKIDQLPPRLKENIFQRVVDFRMGDLDLTGIQWKLWVLLSDQECRRNEGRLCQRAIEPYPCPEQLNETVYRMATVFYRTKDEGTDWGHYTISDLTPQGYYLTWLMFNIYLIAILFEPGLIYQSRRYRQGRWVDRMFSHLFEDQNTLRLQGGYQIQKNTIFIIQLKDIWGRYEPPLVRIIDHDHFHQGEESMWMGCYKARKVLAELYGEVPKYNTHSPISPSVQGTPDLYYREEIRNRIIHGDEEGELEIRDLYSSYLLDMGRTKEEAEWVLPSPERLEDMDIWPGLHDWP